jgi:tetratricopeptide (TPR) repeat protein
MDFALFLLEQGDVEAAKEKCNRILELNPNHAQALFYLGEIALDHGDPAEGEKRFQESLGKDMALAGPHYRLAQCALSAGRTKDAKAHLLAELDLDIQDTNTLVSMGSMFQTLGDNSRATDCLLKATLLDMRNADAYYYLGVSTANKGQLNEAAQFFCRAVDMDANHLAALRDLAFTYLASGQADKAAERIRKARTLSPHDSELRMLDYSIRFVRCLDRAKRAAARLDPRRLFSHGPSMRA